MTQENKFWVGGAIVAITTNFIKKQNDFSYKLLKDVDLRAVAKMQVKVWL